MGLSSDRQVISRIGHNSKYAHTQVAVDRAVPTPTPPLSSCTHLTPALLAHSIVQCYTMEIPSFAKMAALAKCPASRCAGGCVGREGSF